MEQSYQAGLAPMTDDDYLFEVREILSRQLSDDPALMVDQVKSIEAHMARLIFMLGESEAILARVASARLLPKSKELTEFEREISLRAAISEEQKRVNIVSSIIKAIYQRVNLSQSLIRQHGIELQKLS